MEMSLQSLVDASIFTPGDVYILTYRSEPGFDGPPIQYMYHVRNEEEILPLVEFEAVFVLKYQLLEFLGCSKLSASCYEIVSKCYDPEEDKVLLYSLYLHRIMTVTEALKEWENAGSNGCQSNVGLSLTDGE